MQLFNRTPFPFAPLYGKIHPPAHSLSLIVKGSFGLVSGGSAMIAAEQDPLTGDRFREDDLEKLLLYASDFVLFKPKCDLLLSGHAHPPGKKASPKVNVGFRVGSLSKVLSVIGTQVQKPKLITSTVSDPDPFEKMEITYEKSFGGPGFDKNPVGTGASKEKDEEGKNIITLPNVHYPRKTDAELKKKYPAGFGPLPMTWPQRMARVGSYSQKWLEDRWPWFPDDFDWSFFNSAPPDQQLDTYLRGDETLQFENLHPELAEYDSRLPGLRVRCFINVSDQGEARFREVEMNLDTMSVDMDRERIFLTWRGNTEVRSEKYTEILHVLVDSEPVSSPPESIRHYQEVLAESLSLRARADIEFDEEIPEEEPVEASPSEPPAPPPEEEEMKKASKAPGVDPAKIASLAGKPGSPAPSPVKTPPPPEPSPPVPAPPSLEERVERKDDFRAEDLTRVDLSGMNLAGLVFQDTILADANLEGANLAGANLSGANLSGANLAGADLREANLELADLEGALLRGANLSKANMNAADATCADLEEADLSSLRGEGACFFQAQCSSAIFRNASMQNANLSESTLDGTDFTSADLPGASLAKAWGQDTIFEEANLEGAGFAGSVITRGRFRKIKAPGSVWEEAKLFHADFSGGKLDGAEFSSAYLQKAVFIGASLVSARFNEADLREAVMAGVNLFQGSLEKADLTSCDLRHSNLYEAEFFEATTNGTIFEGANLKMTKLA
jgi:uncharacterized protein YjbI with pentapeptide repeats